MMTRTESSFHQSLWKKKSFKLFKEKTPYDTKKLSRLNVVADEVIKSTYVRNEFSQNNDKRFYFPEGVVSLPFYHPILSKIDKSKQKKSQKIEKHLSEEKEDLLRLEKRH